MRPIKMNSKMLGNNVKIVITCFQVTILSKFLTKIGRFVGCPSRVTTIFGTNKHICCQWDRNNVQRRRNCSKKSRKASPWCQIKFTSCDMFCFDSVQIYIKAFSLWPFDTTSESLIPFDMQLSLEILLSPWSLLSLVCSLFRLFSD